MSKRKKIQSEPASVFGYSFASIQAIQQKRPGARLEVSSRTACRVCGCDTTGMQGATLPGFVCCR